MKKDAKKSRDTAPLSGTKEHVQYFKFTFFRFLLCFITFFKFLFKSNILIKERNKLIFQGYGSELNIIRTSNTEFKHEF